MLLAPLALLDLGCLFLRLGGPHQEQEADGLRIDAVHHIFKEREGLALKFHERILLPVTAQPNAFLQVIEREKVIFPLGVHNIEQDVALEPAHGRRAEKSFLLVVARLYFFDQQIGELIVI